MGQSVTAGSSCALRPAGPAGSAWRAFGCAGSDGGQRVQGTAFLARGYLFSAKEQGRTPPPLPVDSNGFVVGKIEGNFEVAQILGPRMFIASNIDRDGIPERSVWVEGISAAGVADQKKFTLTDDAVFQYKGTTSYRTVLGALRTT